MRKKIKKGQKVKFTKDVTRYLGVGQKGTYGEVVDYEDDDLMLIAVQAPGEAVEELLFYRDEFEVVNEKL